MRTLENIQDLKKLLLNPYTIYTYDYADGFIINDTTDYIEIYEIEIEDEPFDEFLGNIITYASEKDLFENLRENLIRMDLTKGADDQYYDYSPSQVEAILFGILQLTPEHQDIIVINLKKHLKSFIQDKDQAEEMITQYTCYYNAIKRWESNHKETEILYQLEISYLLEQLKITKTMKTTNPSSRITLSQNGNQILTCKVYKEPNYILSMSNEEILELISGLDYIGNLPTVPDLEKPIEIQVSTIRRIPLEQNKEVQTKIKEIIYNNLYDTLIDELKGTISRFQAQYNIQEINPYLQDILQNPEDLVSLSNTTKDK